ncbi:MAG TPA: lytic murein transglycosylase B [Candidatus Avisuccinivibrio pullicola]|nr:lytic murein transglycosylase B [Candidatus Avisuccinivibrio pullicola]
MFKKLITALTVGSLCVSATAAPSVEEVASFAGVPADAVRKAISEATLQQSIIDTMQKPYEGKPWWQYRKLFITTSRINAGVRFYLEHEKTLTRAEKTYGVPPEIVCAIIGVETFYGRNMGTWKVLDALYTLGFHYPPRESYFSKEFGQFVKLATREGWDYDTIKGSYAGAMGMGQFMPTSYLEYAVDFDGDGHVNLFESIEDAIGSVASYFRAHGWKQGHGIFYPAYVKTPEAAALTGQEWNLTGYDLVRSGVSTKVNLDPDERVRLFAYAMEDGSDSYGVGLDNFYTIMRYNKSPLYARAVYELSEFIRTEHDKVLLEQGIVVHPEGRRP